MSQSWIIQAKIQKATSLVPFIADFYCHELNLVIEIDGTIHDLESIKKLDKEREAFLKELGLTIIRFRNEDIISNPEMLLSIEKLVHFRLTLNPSPSGRGK